MSLQTAILCAKCKEVLNNEDAIFGTSCGHLYHFLCIRECHNQSTNCSHCEAFRPCIYKMYLEFGTTTLSWEDSEKAIDLYDDLVKKDSLLSELERKYKISQESVQKLEIKLKKLSDAFNSCKYIIEELKERVATQEVVNEFLQKDNELLAINQANRPNRCNQESTTFRKGMERNENVFDSSAQENIFPANNLDTTCKEKQKVGIYSAVTTLKNFFQLSPENSKASNENDGQIYKENPMKNVPVDIPECIKNSLAFEQNSEPIVESNENLVTIRNCRISDLERREHKDIVIFLAKKMRMQLQRNQIENVIAIKNSESGTLLVDFIKPSLAKKFRNSKYLLQKFNATNYLEIM